MKRIRMLNFNLTESDRDNSSPALNFFPLITPDLITRIDRWLVYKMLEGINDPPISIVLWNKEEITKLPSTDHPVARILIKDRMAIIKLIINPELNFGDLYSTGRIDVEGDISAFLCVIYSHIHNKCKRTLLLRLISKRPRINSLSDSRENIYHHYDIGNTFYKLWLDREAMQYTCAYFPDANMNLEEAQLAKMHHICRKLRLQPGQTVVEAGCGWGGFALFMAKEYGVKVKAYNISHEQICFARERVAKENLLGQVEYIEDDYRNIQGNYDVFVSVGMLEHIGIENYRILGEVINRSLKDSGTGLIHTIGRNEPGMLNQWIETRIFPGARPPSISQMMNIFEPWSFSVLDIENLRLHYAKTLEHWLNRFEENQDQIQKMFDAAFVRAWRLYLAGSMAAFTTGTMQLFQVLFTRPQNNDISWSRSHLYDV